MTARFTSVAVLLAIPAFANISLYR